MKSDNTENGYKLKPIRVVVAKVQDWVITSSIFLHWHNQGINVFNFYINLVSFTVIPNFPLNFVSQQPIQYIPLLSGVTLCNFPLSYSSMPLYELSPTTRTLTDRQPLTEVSNIYGHLLSLDESSMTKTRLMWGAGSGHKFYNGRMI